MIRNVYFIFKYKKLITVLKISRNGQNRTPPHPPRILYQHLKIAPPLVSGPPNPGPKRCTGDRKNPRAHPTPHVGIGTGVPDCVFSGVRGGF